jgi:hypothetical protein
MFVRFSLDTTASSWALSSLTLGINLLCKLTPFPFPLALPTEGLEAQDKRLYKTIKSVFFLAF